MDNHTLRASLETFVAGLQRGAPSADQFHRAMHALFASGEQLPAGTLDAELLATLQRLRRLSLEDVLSGHLPKGRRVGKRQKAPIGDIPVDTIEAWLDTIRSTLASLLDGDPPHRSLAAYAQYLEYHDPGADMAFFVPLAIRALEDVQVVGATSQATALARIGATEALPALRRAALRDYRDPADLPAMARSFDFAIKQELNAAIRALEQRAPAAVSEKPPVQSAPLPTSATSALSDEDLQRVERAIGRNLPPAVRDFFLHYPAALRTTVRELGPTPDGQPYRECPADNELTDNPDHLIRANDRSSGYDTDWPDNLFVVGSGACGEIYWVDLDDEHGAVYLFDAGQDPEDSSPVAASLQDFAHHLIRAYAAG